MASRWPIASREELRLPDAGDGETRAALSVEIDSPHGHDAFLINGDQIAGPLERFLADVSKSD